ncbi:hypothetical protein [Histidinibacterium aquaticum]|uniref:Uncharacterized protein n=1 Tax=Histidinibacterium aquaticum TaxID=2613962 RepID=A0A5J5GFE6_9RHOB|nr:hypothetical protein [Histidinibacterium aquaticum]KAA9006959.1 hypothetical protein F3S47_14430 [Histidinibacterium aquaticum]
MTKHIIDQPKDTTNGRLGRFLKLERAARPDAKTVNLQRRSRGDGASRLKRFLRIDRGMSA